MIFASGFPQDTSDYLRPVALTVTFVLDNTTKPGPVLDEGSPTSIRKLVSCAKPCPRDPILSFSVNSRERGGRRHEIMVTSDRGTYISLSTFPQLYSFRLAFLSALSLFPLL